MVKIKPKGFLLLIETIKITEKGLYSVLLEFPPEN